MKPAERLELARGQLSKVQVAWLQPTDWADLTIYGMHALENAVVAAANHHGLEVKKTHPDKTAVAQRLHEGHHLPDVSELLTELNELRKGFSYGEPTLEPSMSAEDIAAVIEEYIDAVARVIGEPEAT
ncbi:MAG TPA: hypothetical protein VHI71_09200 [Actinomycetota bacterium]|nr:hypothetical protein [Actinomycetota bacterium]